MYSYSPDTSNSTNIFHGAVWRNNSNQFLNPLRLKENLFARWVPQKSDEITDEIAAGNPCNLL